MFAVFVSLIQSTVCNVITYWKLRVVLSDSVVSVLLKHVVKCLNLRFISCVFTYF